MSPFRRVVTAPHMLTVGMTGVKMGDRIAHIGCEDGARMAAVAAKVGLSGRAVVFVPDEPSAIRARKGAEKAGVLVEIEVTRPTALPADDNSFDLTVVDDTGGLLATMAPTNRATTVRELARILRPGGRLMVIGSAPTRGFRSLFARSRGGPLFDAQPTLEADGFRFVRNLAERDGLRFLEGIKPRS